MIVAVRVAEMARMARAHPLGTELGPVKTAKAHAVEVSNGQPTHCADAA